MTEETMQLAPYEAPANEADEADEPGDAGKTDDAGLPGQAEQADASPLALPEGTQADEDAIAPARVTLPKRESHASTYVIAGCIIALLALTVLGSMLNVGDHLYAAHPALGIAFYAIVVALVAVGIVIPVAKVAKRPIFSLYQLRDEQGRAKQRRCRMLVDNLVANADLTDEQVAYLEECLQKGDGADDLLIDFFNEHCIPRIDAETKRAASSAFFVSAICRSPLVTTVTMLSICLDLVRSIVETCGFRPTNLGLARLYSRVMISALIVGGVEDSDLSDLLAQLMGGGAGARAGGIVLGATAEGLMSAFLTFRVGVITKRWLTAADGPARMAQIRRTSYREALALMRSSDFMQTVADTVKQTTGSVASGVANTVSNAAKSTVDNAKASIADTMHNLQHRLTHWD